MKNFIKGMLFIGAIIPILDGFLSLFNQCLEYVCSKIAVATYNLKKDITLEEEESQNTQVMGFTIPAEEAESAVEE